jgi:hypothetical protein
MTRKGSLLRVAAITVLIVTLLGLAISLPAAAQTGIVSDDFNALQLDTNVWTWVDPLSDCSHAMTGAGTNDAWVQISVAAGTTHSLWAGGVTNSPRIVQPVNDTDFEIEAKFESAMWWGFQTQGIIVQQDSIGATSLYDYLRFEFHSNGSNIYTYVASISGGAATTRHGPHSFAYNGTAPLWMRVTRSGNGWTMSYSFDGQSWTPISSFSHSISVAAAGVYAGNEGANPAYTMSADYFFDTAAPVVPEDGPLAVDLDSFTATPQTGAILIEWETANEIDNLGFRLYRTDDQRGELLSLTEDLIPSQAPGSPTGFHYEFVDRSAVPGVVYDYWLEDVDFYGFPIRHGPVSAAADMYRVFLPLSRR